MALVVAGLIIGCMALAVTVLNREPRPDPAMVVWCKDHYNLVAGRMVSLDVLLDSDVTTAEGQAKAEMLACQREYAERATN